jgi:DNA-binding beta-propeller fold protein YncE
MILDASSLVDNAYPDLIFDIQIGWLPAPTAKRDDGVVSRSAVGPAQLVVHPDGQRLLVSNFNANSITVYDLALGPYGTLTGEVPLLGENPYALELTPDGKLAVFANFTGEVTGSLVESTIGVLDIDPDSPTYLSVLTWIANR